MKINRIWAMPNKWTFSIKPIAVLIQKYMKNNLIWCDPFTGYNQFKKMYNIVTNDIDKNKKADYHLESLEFLKQFDNNYFDGCFYDPPYSNEQSIKTYNHNTNELNQPYWHKDRKNEIARIIKMNGIVISFGWNSNGIGKKRGFEILEVLLVPHGSIHHDTIITVEQKLDK